MAHRVYYCHFCIVYINKSKDLRVQNPFSTLEKQKNKTLPVTKIASVYVENIHPVSVNSLLSQYHSEIILIRFQQKTPYDANFKLGPKKKHVFTNTRLRFSPQGREIADYHVTTTFPCKNNLNKLYLYLTK